MRIIKQLIFYGIFIFIPMLTLNSQTPANDANWIKSSLSSEFDGTSLPSNWWASNRIDAVRFWNSPSDGTPYNLPSNVTVSGGKVRLDTRWDNTYSTYTTGAIMPITTYHYNGHYGYLGYGYYEASIQFASGTDVGGCWEMVGGSGSSYREIDVSEKFNQVGYLTTTDFQSSTNVHGSDYNWAGPFQYINSPTSLCNQQHTYAIEWTPSTLIYYFDGKAIREIYNEPRVPNQAMNLRIGIDANSLMPKNITKSCYVDYVRVYTLNKDVNVCKLDVSISDLNSFNFQLYKNIVIGSLNSNITVSKNMTFRATNEVTINGEFNVPLGYEFNITPTSCDSDIPY